jgi:hypothetical protein
MSASRGQAWISRVRARIINIAAVVIGFVLSVVAIQVIAHSI